MGIVEALGLAQSGHRVRPKCWRTRPGRVGCFVEVSARMDVVQVSRNMGDCIVPEMYRLDRIEELAGEWETVEVAALEASPCTTTP